MFGAAKIELINRARHQRLQVHDQVIELFIEETPTVNESWLPSLVKSLSSSITTSGREDAIERKQHSV